MALIMILKQPKGNELIVLTYDYLINPLLPEAFFR